MAREINSFVMYYDWQHLFNDFTLEQKGILFESIYLHTTTGATPKISDSVVKNVFNYIAIYLDRDKEKYIEKCKKMEENAKKRLEKAENKKKDKYSYAGYDIDEYNKKLDEEG